MQWLVENRDWFFSGAGLFIASTIASLLSVFITVWWKSRSDSKKRKRLRICQTVNKFSVPTSNNTVNVSPDHFKVSYKGSEYENLSIYYISLMNVGIVAIENQRIHIQFPEDAKIIETIQDKSISSISIEKTDSLDESKHEEIYCFDRLEANDACGITYLVDLQEAAAINYQPRGVDNIEYVRTDEVGRSDLETLVVYFAIFFIVGSIPIVGGLAQGVVIIASMPLLLEMYRKTSVSNKNAASVKIQGGIEIAEKGVFSINQST